MAEQRVDYDRIASGYNRRFEANGTPGVAVALQSLARTLAGEHEGDSRALSVLEVGCGTGHWLAGLEGGHRLWGLDLSAGMLHQARQRPVALHLVRGRAGRLPFATGSFDLVYCVNALHHFEDRAGFVVEARRLLRAGGALAVVGLDPRRARQSWYVYDYFPGTYEADLARFPSWGTVADWMIAAGLGPLAWRRVEEIHDTKQGRAVLRDPFLQKDATSQLTLLDDEAYAAGLRRIQSALVAAERAGQTLSFATDLTLDMLVGRLAPGRPEQAP
jgi:ubiquinone/menaquinone biosynthesis C-methylase UbiE